MGRRLKLDLGAAAGASPRPRSCQEVSLAFFLRGKGEMHLKAPFFPIFPLKAQPPNPARKAPNQHIPSSLGSGVLSRTGDTFGTAPPGRTWPILNKTSNKSVSTQLRCGGFHVKSSFYSPHSSFFFFFVHPCLPVPGSWDGFSLSSEYLSLECCCLWQIPPASTLHICC